MVKYILVCSLIVLAGVIVSMVEAAGKHPKISDEVWEKRAIEALKRTEEAYNPNPMETINNINHRVHLAMEGNNKTRRGLGVRYLEQCEATNPIDKCWRCDPNWAKDRMKLASCPLGFGKGTTGGKGGRIYVITDPSDSDLVNPKEGTLRHAVIQSEPLWIIFERDMNIKLTEELLMCSDKTIDGRGAEVHIADGAGITIQLVKNVIIHNVHIHDIKPGHGGTIRDSLDHFGKRAVSDGDAIEVFGSTNVWLDHLTMSNCADGLIDVVQASTAVSITNCLFTKHDHVMLLGASDTFKEDKMMQVTVAFNHFGEGLVQRMPHLRFGFAHVLNNDYTHWIMYAIGGCSTPTILSQGNQFVAPNNPAAKEVGHRNFASEAEWKNWNWKSEGDILLNGATFTQSGDPKHKFNYPNMIAPKPGDSVPTLTKSAGFLKCVENMPC